MSKVVSFALFGALFLAVASSADLSAQQQSSKQSKAPSQWEAVTPKLIPEQEHGLRLLKVAEAESAGQPDMHAFVLWWASRAYKKLDPKEAKKLSRDAFIATQAIEDASEDDRCAAPGSAGDMKSWIQQAVLNDMVYSDQLQEIEQLLPQATASVRSEITAALVRHTNRKKT